MFEGAKPTSVFEFGCANGGLLKDLQQEYPGLKVGGADMNLSDIEKARQNFPEYAHNFILHNVSDKLPIPDYSYDYVFGVGIFMYLLNPQLALEEAIRISRKGVVLAEFHNDDMSDLGGLLRVEWPPGKFHLAIIRNYEKLFESIGKKATIKHSGIDKHIITYEKH